MTEGPAPSGAPGPIRVLRLLVRIVAAGLLLSGLALAGLLTRLYLAPLHLDLILPSLAALVAEQTRTDRVEIGGLVLSWQGPGTPLDLRAEGIRMFKGDDLVLGAPRLELSVTLIDLLRGQVRLTRGDLIEPRVLVSRGEQGQFWLGVGVGPAPPERPARLQETEDGPWVRLLGGGPGDRGPLGALDSFRIRDADVTLRDAYRDTEWTARAANLRLDRENGQLGGNAALTLEAGAAPMHIAADFAFATESHTGRLDLRFEAIQAQALARLVAPALLPADLQVDLPIAGQASARFARSAIPTQVEINVDAVGGHFLWPEGTGPEPLRLGALRLALTGRPRERTLNLETLSLALTEPAVTLDADAELTGTPDGPKGRVTVSLAHGGETARLVGRIRPDDSAEPGAWSVLDALLEPVRLDRFATLLPALAPLAAVRTPVSGGGTLAVSKSLVPRHAWLDLRAEAGTLELQDAVGPLRRTRPYALSGAHAVLGYSWQDRRLTVPSLQLALTDPPLRLDLSGAGSTAPEALQGNATLRLNPGGVPATVRLSLDRSPAETTGASPYRLRIALQDLQPSRFAALDPLLAPLAAGALPLSGTLTLLASPTGSPERALFDLSAGRGRLFIPDFLTDFAEVETLAVAGEVAWPLLPAPALLRIERLAADFRGPRLEGSGSARLVEAGIDLEGSLRATDVPVDRLPILWPTKTAPGARRWVLGHVQAGFVPEAWLEGAGIGAIDDPGEIEARFARGGFEARDVAVRYFGELAPVTGVSGRGQATDKTTLTIDTTGGQVRDVALGPGRIVITKLNEDDQDLSVSVPLQGPIRTTLAVLDQPPLGYARRMEIAPAQVSGRHESRLELDIPLIEDVDFDDVTLSVQSQLSDAAIRDVAADFDLSQAALAMQVTNTAVTATGTGRIDDVPTRIDFRQSLTDDEPTRTRVTLAGTVPVRQLARYGPSLEPQVTGTMGADVSIGLHRTKGLSVTSTLNLADTVIEIPAIGLHKERGSQGQVHFTLGFENRIPTSVTNLRVSTGPLLAQGLMKLESTGSGWPDRVILTHLELGQSRLRGDAIRTGRRAYRVQLFGDTLDGQATLAYMKQPGEADAAYSDDIPATWPELDIQGQVGRLLLGPGPRYLDQALFTLHHDRRRWDAFTLNARLGTSLGKMRMVYQPDGPRQAVSVRTDDAGTFLRAFGVTETVRHGDLALIGSIERLQPGLPMTGQVALKDFKVVGVPLLARMLNALSITGLLELLTDEGLGFRRLHAGYTLKGPLLSVEDLRSAGGALGLTLDGRINLANSRIAAQGTVVPAYTVNRLLGLIPFLGNLLSGGEGQGLFAATYRVTGTLGEPNIAVNPLSILAPGFLRNLFFLDDAADDSDLDDLVQPIE